MSCHQDDMVQKLACVTKFGHTHLTNRSNSLEGLWFREGTMHVCWRKGDSFLLRPSNFFLRLTCTNTIVMWKIGNFQGSFDLLKTFKWFPSHFMTVIKFKLDVHAMPKHNGLKNHICVLVCELIPCAVKYKEFSNILVSRHGHMYMHGVSFQKIENDQKNMKPCLM